MRAFSTTSQAFTPSQFGINLLGSTTFPEIQISNADPTLANELQFGPAASFGDAGMYQNQWELGSTMNWVKGRHTIAFGGLWDHTQLNIINQNTNTDTIAFKSLLNFVEGNVRTGTRVAKHSAARRIAITGQAPGARSSTTTTKCGAT